MCVLERGRVARMRYVDDGSKSSCGESRLMGWVCIGIYRVGEMCLRFSGI